MSSKVWFLRDSVQWTPHLKWMHCVKFFSQHEKDWEAASSTLDGHGWHDAATATAQEADQGQEEDKRQRRQKGGGEEEQGDKENGTLDKSHFAPLVVTVLRL